MDHFPVVIIGAGPAGLTAAYELASLGLKPLLLEKTGKVGGLARTEIYQGYRFDIGGHRFFTKSRKVQKLWETILGEDFLEVPRLSRIYYNNRFFHYPLEFLDTLSKLGLWESSRILLSYVKARISPSIPEENFGQWVSNRFGRRLFETFFQHYTEKVWGVSCQEIGAEWAAQRIDGLSLMKALAHALWKKDNGGKTLIKKFHYPVYGSGQMWERLQQKVQNLGGQIRINSKVISLGLKGRRIHEIVVQEGEEKRVLAGSFVISSMPLSELIARLDPPPPTEVIEAARNLSYRDFILVGLIINRPHLFPDQWIYVHSQKVKVGRIQNFKNWSAAMVPDQKMTNLGMEFFCNKGDDLWTLPDKDLIALAIEELTTLGLADASEVEGGVVFRQLKAYPAYNLGYQDNLKVIKDFLTTISNLRTVGRNGMHRYNNMDHSMLSGMMAVKNLDEENHDLWEINLDHSYLEKFTTASRKTEFMA
ncbi:MAG: NAD(P)/FAD-dependent oxidoreductase [Desulfobaccales bacterium]|jgi:protoporphyrinogen oxidase